MSRQRRTRRERSEDASSRRRTATVTLAAVSFLGVAIAITALLMLGGVPGFGATSNQARQATLGAFNGNDPAAAAAAMGREHAAQTATATASVEVPDLVGKTVSQATALLEAVGLTASLQAGLTENDTVAAQDPAPATVVPPATSVKLSGQAPDLITSDRAERALAALDAPATAAAAAGSARAVPRGTTFVVVIDPGHQSRGDSTHEPVGPGATETKPRVTGGTSGVATRIPEYELVLQISTVLKAELERAGVTVIMTRSTNDVNISNSERAKIANDAGADLFVRIHADGSTNPDIAGISTLYPGENRWTTPIAAPSKRAAALVQEATVAATGATSRGTVARTDISGFNWSQVPSVLVECGFMSNAVEDRLLSSPHYQDKLAKGMTAGILGYLTEGAPDG